MSESAKVRGSPSVRRVERWIFECRSTDGSKYYRLDYRTPDCRRVREPAGRYLTDARNLRAKREVEIAAGTFEHPDDRKHRQAEARRRAAGVPTFEAFAKRFEQEYGSQRRSDYYEMMLRQIRPYFEGKRLDQITPGDLDRYRVHCMDADRVSPSTTRKRLNVLGTLFKHALRWGVLTVNPAADLEKPSEPTHKTRYLSREEFEQLREHAEPWLRPVLTVAVLTGARLKEICGLRWENVDRDAGVLFISEDNKTAKPRGVPMAVTVRKILDEIPGSRFKREGYVFVFASGEPYVSERQRSRISQRTRAAAKAADLPGVTFHTLRHTAGSWLAQAGYSQVKIAKLLGHATTATTDRYMHLSPAHLKDAADTLSNLLDGHVEDTKTEAVPLPPSTGSAIVSPINEMGG